MRRLFIILVTLLWFVVFPSGRDVYAQSERCFTETNQCISGVIRQYWETNGGLPVFGYPISPLATETNADGFTGPTQWFERDRLEDHSAEGKGVLAGRLGAQKLAAEGRPWESLPQASRGAAGCRFFFETAHSLCPPFLAYWERNGGLARFGYPISEPGTETNAAGFRGTFQWFERRRMEAHPENQPPYDILLGLLGNETRGSSPPAGPPTQPPTQPPPANNSCANIPAPTDAIIEPNCVRYGESFNVVTFGWDNNQPLGYWITDQNGRTVGTRQTVNADGGGRYGGTVSTTNWFGLQLGPGNYNFVASDACNVSPAEKYQDSIAPFRVIGGTSSPPPTNPQPNPPPTNPPPTNPPGVPNPGGTCAQNAPAPAEGAQAWMTVTNPTRRSNTTPCVRLIVNGQAVQGATASGVAHYKSTDTNLGPASTGGDGIAVMTFSVGDPTAGYTVRVDARVTYQSRLYSASTSFTPR